MTQTEATRYLSKLTPELRLVANAVHERLIQQGCDTYVKTIYIGYEFRGEMVAALYAHSDHIELALALDENDPSPLLADASHLTWRTLPVSVDIRALVDVAAVLSLCDRSCDRVAAGAHDVNRDNEYFMNAKRERQLRRGRQEGRK